MVQTLRTLVSGFAALAGLLAWIGAGIVAGHTAFYWTRVGRAEGQVVTVHQVPCGFVSASLCPDPEIRFETADRGPILFRASEGGTIVTLQQQVASLPAEAGQSVPVLYDVRQPGRARIASNNLLWGLPARLFGGGVFLLVIAFFFRPGRPVGELGIMRDRFGR